MAPVAVTPQATDDVLSSKLGKLDLASKPTEAAPKQPDIAYHPDEAKWKARTARRLAEDPSLPLTPLPEGFPQVLESPLVWEGKDWKDESQWTYNLSEAELKEIDAALKHFRGTNPKLSLIQTKQGVLMVVLR